MNISIAIADSNRDYIERLSEILQEYDDLEVSIFTSAEKLSAALERNSFDVVLFDPDLSSEKLVFPNVKLPVCLYSDEAKNKQMYDSAVRVIKYQRISRIYKEIIKEYADKAGYSAEFDRSARTSIIAVCSPIGGSGKTTVSLALASKLASSGKTVLYLSTEQLSSAAVVNPSQEEGITVLLESLEESVNFELKLKGIMKPGQDGMYYIEGFSRIVDYGDVNASEMKEIVSKIKKSGVCDILMIDTGSMIDEMNAMLMEEADKIVLVDRVGEIAHLKMSMFAEQAIVQRNQQKMLKVANFMDPASKCCNVPEAPFVGKIRNYGNIPVKALIKEIAASQELDINRLA